MASDLHPGIAALLETETVKDSDYLPTPNEFHGVDFIIPAGSVRLSAEYANPGETIDLYRFTRNLTMEWSLSFTGNTPRSVVCAALEQALKF